MNEDYFVSISDPVFLEKSLLSDVKSSLEFSIINQKIQDLKSEKAKLFVNLKTDLTEIATLLSDLDEKLPHKELLVPEKPKLKPKVVSKKKAPKPRVINFSKMDKLNASLAEIERRLEELS